jgi:hypothetical protein
MQASVACSAPVPENTTASAREQPTVSCKPSSATTPSGLTHGSTALHTPSTRAGLLDWLTGKETYRTTPSKKNGAAIATNDPAPLTRTFRTGSDVDKRKQLPRPAQATTPSGSGLCAPLPVAPPPDLASFHRG